jgi:hypothetical protein
MKESYFGFIAKSKEEVNNVKSVLKPLGFSDTDSAIFSERWPIMWVTETGRIDFAQKGSCVSDGLTRDWKNDAPDMVHFFREQLPVLLKKQSRKVVLSDKYVAEVYPDNRVVVGCSTFTHDAVLAVAKMIRELKGL